MSTKGKDIANDVVTSYDFTVKDGHRKSDPNRARKNNICQSAKIYYFLKKLHHLQPLLPQ